MTSKYTIWYIPFCNRNELNTKIIDIVDTYEDAISRIKEIFETNNIDLEDNGEDEDNGEYKNIFIGKIAGSRFQDVIGYVYDGRNEFTEVDSSVVGQIQNTRIRNIVRLRLGIFKYDKYNETFNSLNKKVLSKIY